MAPDSYLADASNGTFVAAIVAYAVAMLGFAVEYAFARTGTQAREEKPALVTTGGGDASRDDEPPRTNDSDKASARANAIGISVAQARIGGTIAMVAMIVGAIAHTGSLILRAASVGRVPWGNMFEYIVATALVGVLVWIYLVVRNHVARRLSLFTMLAVVLLLGFSTRVYTDAAQLVPALDSYWIAIHVSAAIIASGIFMVGFVAAVLHLIRRRHQAIVEKGARVRFPFTAAPQLPSAKKLETLTWRMHLLAFPLYTFGIIAGAIWAREAWSRYWGWDPKEVWAFVAWVVYAAYLHSRATGSTGRKLAPWIAIVGWLVILFNLFGVNLLMEGLHSYSGL